MVIMYYYSEGVYHRLYVVDLTERSATVMIEVRRDADTRLTTRD